MTDVMRSKFGVVENEGEKMRNRSWSQTNCGGKKEVRMASLSVPFRGGPLISERGTVYDFFY
jgi:hypothetical protein